MIFDPRRGVPGGRAELALRGRLEAGRVRGVRLGVPAVSPRADGAARRTTLEIVTRMLAPGLPHATYEGFAGFGARGAINVPKGEEASRGSRSWSAATGPTGHGASRLASRTSSTWTGCRPTRLLEARPVIREPVRGDRARPGDAAGLGPHLAPRQGRAGPGAHRPARGLPRAGRRANHRIPPGLGARPGRAGGLRRRHGPGRLRPARRLAGSPGTPRSRSDLRDHERRTLGTSCHPSASRWI